VERAARRDVARRPRPERPELTAEIERDPRLRPAPRAAARDSPAWPRCTAATTPTAEYKLGYDLQYLVNWSLVLDLQILARTVWVVVTRRV
jgi:lipopolysaccharide/colanic/teichoic acid biosynthesis glycosyltransferase